MSTATSETSDPGDLRRTQSGIEIPSEGYCDQPYVVETHDGAWLCVMTTGTGHEGDPGQHPVTFRSHDRGVTWGEKASLEPSDGPEASYAVLLKVPSGRVYAFYNYNTNRVREVKTDAAELEQAPVVLTVPPGKGKKKRTGSLLELAPSSVRLLALKRAEDGRGFILRAQAAPGKAVKVSALWLGKKIQLGALNGGEIATWKLQSTKTGWKPRV